MFGSQFDNQAMSVSLTPHLARNEPQAMVLQSLRGQAE